jgi:hypothetical protein
VILYCLEFANGKAYIGVTARSAALRYREHELAARDGKAAVYCAWRRHGAPAMTTLKRCATKAELLSAEAAAIVSYDTLAPRGYNMTPGGDSNPMDDPEIARRAGDKNIGRRHTVAARRNMGLARRGKPLSAEHRLNISAGQRGRVHSVDTLEKIRVRAIERQPSDAMRACWAEQSAKRKGIKKGPLSEETKRKLSTVRRAYWERMRSERPDELKAIIAKSAQGIERAWARRRGV